MSDEWIIAVDTALTDGSAMVLARVTPDGRLLIEAVHRWTNTLDLGPDKYSEERRTRE